MIHEDRPENSFNDASRPEAEEFSFYYFSMEHGHSEMYINFYLLCFYSLKPNI